MISAPYPFVAACFTGGESLGMMIVVGMPSSFPQRAIACAWFPEEYANTPCCFWVGESWVMVLNAPRSLNDPEVAERRLQYLRKLQVALALGGQ